MLTKYILNKILLILITFLLFSCTNENINSENLNDNNFQELLNKHKIEGNGVTDIDGNTYRTVKIGNQEWMCENLRVTRFRNGDSIIDINRESNTYNKNELQNIMNSHINNRIKNRSKPAYFKGLPDYFNDETNENIGSNENKNFGCMYNLLTVIDQRNIAPVGYHIASKDDWEKLFKFIGGSWNSKCLYKIRKYGYLDNSINKIHDFNENENAYNLSLQSEVGNSSIYWTLEGYKVKEIFDYKNLITSKILKVITERDSYFPTVWEIEYTKMPKDLIFYNIRCVKNI